MDQTGADQPHLSSARRKPRVRPQVTASSATNGLELHAVMPDGSVWAVPAHVIADHRARHYAASDVDATYDEEYAYGAENGEELACWAGSGMKWTDLEAHARQVSPASGRTGYAAAWSSAEKRVVRSTP